MNWNELNQTNQIEDLIVESETTPVGIFKHSTRCSISSTVLDRLERKWDKPTIKMYYLDLIKHRDISNLIAERFNVEHESPQLIILQNGQVVYHDSHYGISVDGQEVVV